MKKINFYNNKIAVIGLGYVGLPLAIEFSKKFKVVGYDLDLDKINNIKKRKNISEITKKNYSQINSIELINNKNLFIIDNFLGYIADMHLSCTQCIAH